MNNINSQYKGDIVSMHEGSKVTSTTITDIKSKTDLHVTSDAEAAAERAAFLTTAKRNASIMFAKYL